MNVLVAWPARRGADARRGAVGRRGHRGRAVDGIRCENQPRNTAEAMTIATNFMAAAIVARMIDDRLRAAHRRPDDGGYR
jgi:hypothetical protein